MKYFCKCQGFFASPIGLAAQKPENVKSKSENYAVNISMESRAIIYPKAPEKMDLIFFI